MTVEQLVSIIAATPEGKAVGLKEFWADVMDDVLRPVLNKIATMYDWDFAMAEYSDKTTIASTADYEMTGTNFDLRDIVNIRLGSGKKVLNHRRPAEADGAQSESGTIGGTNSWYSFKTTDDGYPIVTLFDTPSSGGDALHVRYRMKDVPLSRFPGSFDWVIVDGVMGQLSDAKQARFNRSLKQMIKNYRDGGADVSIVGMDSHIANSNSKSASLNRVG